MPPETGASKGPEADVSKQRPEIGDHDARGMAAKTAFLLASYQLRVSEDWVVADAVERNRVSRNREFSEIFRPEQAADALMAADQSNFDSNPNQIHKR